MYCLFHGNTSHHQTNLLNSCAIPVDNANDGSFINYGDAVRKSADFIQIFRNQQYGGTGIALLQQSFMNVFGSANIHPTGWLGGNQDLWVAGKFACHDQFLDVATG